MNIDWDEQPTPTAMVMLEVQTETQYWVEECSDDYREIDGPHMFEKKWIKNGCYEVYKKPNLNCYKPEVGEVCEAWFDGEYRKAEALKYHANTDAVAFDFGFSLKWSSDYKPCKTEREQFIEKSAEIFKGPEQALYSMISGALYDNGARFKED